MQSWDRARAAGLSHVRARTLSFLRDCFSVCQSVTARRLNKEEVVVVEVLLYVHRNHRLIRDGSPGWPPRLSHSSWARRRRRRRKRRRKEKRRKEKKREKKTGVPKDSWNKWNPNTGVGMKDRAASRELTISNNNKHWQKCLPSAPPPNHTQVWGRDDSRYARATVNVPTVCFDGRICQSLSLLGPGLDQARGKHWKFVFSFRQVINPSGPICYFAHFVT